MAKRGKIPGDTFEGVIYRQAQIESDAGDDGSIGVTIATESPVEVYDFARRQVIREVLLVDGIEFPQQIPIVDSHNRTTVRNVLGSLRGLSTDDGSFQGRAYFSSKPTAQEAMRDVLDGHITDFSVTARNLASVFIPEGQTQVVNGKTYEGPTRVVTRSKALDGSIVAIGADSNAKVMRAYLDPRQLEEDEMADTLRELCLRKGMPEDCDDVQRWADDNLQVQPKVDPEEPAKVEAVAPTEVKREEAEVVETTKDVQVELQRALKIGKMCREHGISEDQSDKWVTDGLSIDEVARHILEARKPGDKPLGSPQPVESEADKFLAAASAGMTLRTLQGARVNPHKALEQANGTYQGVETGSVDHEAIARSEALVATMQKPAPGFRDFQYMSCAELARQFLVRAGEQRVDNLPKHEIIRRAIRHEGLIERSGAAFHTTGSFANLMLDAARKTLLAAYDEAAVTYPIWVRNAPSAPDFKTLNRIRFGELPDPEIVPENHPYPEKSPSDNKETYNVEKHGEIFSISLEALVNDDLNALSRIPAMQGNAMRRKINRTVYSVLTTNAALSDGVALFHATSHGANLDAVALSATALNTGYTVMMTQAGLNSTTILNIMPRFLIVPAALASTALQIVNSTADPTVGGAATGSSGVANLYGPNGPRRLVPIAEGQLDASSTTAWWLAADSSQVDTVELCFLQGEESPVLEREMGFETDSIKWKIRQTFAAAAIDFRGLYQGNS